MDWFSLTVLLGSNFYKYTFPVAFLLGYGFAGMDRSYSSDVGHMAYRNKELGSIEMRKDSNPGYCVAIGY